MFKLYRIVKRLRYNEQGNALVIIGFALPMLVLLVGAAVDFSRVYMVRAKSQLALDTAVLSAAASVSSQPPEMVAETYAKANFPDNYMDANLNASNMASSIAITVVDPNDGTLNVSGVLTSSVKNYFLGLIGLGNMSYQVTSEAQRGVRPLDLVLVADHSGSMCNIAGTTTALPTCPKLEDLKNASHVLIDTLYGARTSLDGVYVGIVPYATHVKYNVFGTSADPRFGGNGMDPTAARNPNQTSVREYTGNKASIHANISSMAINLPSAGEAWTRINVGLDGAWRMLRPDYNSNFAHTTVAPRPFNGDTMKAVVLMTDGRNITFCPGASTPKYINPDDNADLALRCDMMKKDGILIYTVAFDLNGADGATVAVKKLLEDCATNPSYFFDAANPAQMTKAFKEIGDSLRVIRLTK